jgi:hypothetical protein
MTDNNHEHTNPELRRFEHNELERALDAALAKYAAVDPRPGLEERVLAHLRAAPVPSGWMTWKRWTAAGFAVVAIVLAFGLAMTWRTNRHSQPTIANHSSAPPQPQPQAETPVATNQPRGAQSLTPAPKIAPSRVHPQPELAAVTKLPRLDQFPSPQPLSDQEKLLANYIALYPQRAALLAEMRMEDLRRDAEEHRRLAAEDSQQKKNEQ